MRLRLLNNKIKLSEGSKTKFIGEISQSEDYKVIAHTHKQVL